MPSVVYTHPLGFPERVFVSGLGRFEHGVPRELDAEAVASVLGAIKDGVFENNACFSLASAATSAATSAASAADAAPDTVSDASASDGTTQRAKRKKE